MKKESVHYYGRTATFLDETFTLDRNERYYLSTTTNGPRRRLHQVVWYYYNGDIPEGKVIHHIDFNPKNNSIKNLQCLTPKEHITIHAANPTPKQIKHRANFSNISKAWHNSPEGKLHHTTIQKKILDAREAVPMICKNCSKVYDTKFPWISIFCNKECREEWYKLNRGNK